VSIFTAQEQMTINRGAQQTTAVCPVCEHPIDDDNRTCEIPAYLLNVKPELIPPRLCEKWAVSGCQECVNDLVYEFAQFWLSRGVGMMEDVAALIADHLELHLPRKVRPT